MKKISYLGLLFGLMATPAFAVYTDEMFRDEIIEGVDMVATRANIDMPDEAPGALGLDVYQDAAAGSNKNVQLFIPSKLYIRAGGGYNLTFATDSVNVGDEKHKTNNSWTTQIGLGWNLSSYVRTEIDLQESTFNFDGIENMGATYQTVGGMLYFDLLRRYIQSGDVLYRRHFVPFLGLGVAAGVYGFDGDAGSDGFVIAAPRATFGFNIMLNDLIGIDIMYQYQMMIGNGFGWNVQGNSGVYNISNVMASFRVNF